MGGVTCAVTTHRMLSKLREDITSVTIRHVSRVIGNVYRSGTNAKSDITGNAALLATMISGRDCLSVSLPLFLLMSLVERESGSKSSA